MKQCLLISCAYAALISAALRVLLLARLRQWDDLNEASQTVWAKLGWSAENWASGDGVATERMAWNDLSAEQKQAALELSYDERLWDDESDNGGSHYE
jgi:hypothetical protein